MKALIAGVQFIRHTKFWLLEKIYPCSWPLLQIYYNNSVQYHVLPYLKHFKYVSKVSGNLLWINQNNYVHYTIDLKALKAGVQVIISTKFWLLIKMYPSSWPLLQIYYNNSVQYHVQPYLKYFKYVSKLSGILLQINQNNYVQQTINLKALIAGVHVIRNTKLWLLKKMYPSSWPLLQIYYNNSVQYHVLSYLKYFKYVSKLHGIILQINQNIYVQPNINLKALIAGVQVIRNTQFWLF